MPSNVYDKQKVYNTIKEYYNLPDCYTIIPFHIENWKIYNCDSGAPYLVIAFTAFSNTGKIFSPHIDYLFRTKITITKDDDINPLMVDLNRVEKDKKYWLITIMDHFFSDGDA